MRIQKMLGLVGIAAAAMLTANASADTYLWTGGDSNQNWNDQDNWFNVTDLAVSGYPGYPNTSGDVAIIPDRDGDDPEVSTTIQIAELSVQSDAVLTVSTANFTVTDSAYIEGEMYISNVTHNFAGTDVEVALGGLMRVNGGSAAVSMSSSAEMRIYGELRCELGADISGTGTLSLKAGGRLGALNGSCSIAAAVILDDEATAEWFADDTGAAAGLIFNESYDGNLGQPELNGEFQLYGTAQFTVATGKVLVTFGNYDEGSHVSPCAGIIADQFGFVWGSGACEP